MSFFDDFFDGFFLFLAFLASFLVFADFLLGEKKRASIRENVGVFWLHLEDLKYRQLVLHLLTLSNDFMSVVFGSNFISKRRTLSTLTLVALVVSSYVWWSMSTILGRGLLVFHKCSGSIHLNWENFQPDCELLAVTVHPEQILEQAGIAALIILIAMFVTVPVTQKMLVRMVSARNFTVQLAYFLFDVFAAFFVAYLVFLALGWYHDEYFTWKVNLQAQQDFREILEHHGYPNPSNAVVIESFSIFRSTDRHVSDLVFATSVFLFLPTVFYIALVLMAVAAKFSKSLWLPIMSLLALRLHESKKGVLSNLAIAVSLVAKLLQQTIKFLTG